MTGWDWENRRSLWVAFDFDALPAMPRASASLTKPAQVKEAAVALPYVEVRLSTGGGGIHLRLLRRHPVPTTTRSMPPWPARSWA